MAQHTTTPANPGRQSTALAVELHITGGTTNGALTEAEAYGKFITHIAEATKALGNAVAETRFEESKDAHGRATKRRVRIQPLLIKPATSGNDTVHITFRAPEPLPHHELTVGVEEQLPLADFPEDTIESEALRTHLPCVHCCVRERFCRFRGTARTARNSCRARISAARRHHSPTQRLGT